MPMLMTFICLASTVAGLFEDQAGGFDWRQSYMGQVRQLGSHTTSITSVLVVDSKKIGEAVRRVVKTSFHAGNIGEPSVGSVRTLSWCVRGGGPTARSATRRLRPTLGVVWSAIPWGRRVVETAWAMSEEEDNSWQLVTVMQDVSLVSISPLGNLMLVRKEGLASMQMVQMGGMGAYEDKYENMFALNSWFSHLLPVHRPKDVRGYREGGDLGREPGDNG